MNEGNKPEFGKSNLGPRWWHPHGIKMVMRNRGKREPLIIESGVARLEIKRNSGGGCIAAWRIVHDSLSGVDGRVLMTEKEFKHAFGLVKQSDDLGDEILSEYGGTAASPGVFIRYEEWLNIPCPGTGLSGDPNISLKITHEMKKEAIRFIDGN